MTRLCAAFRWRPQHHRARERCYFHQDQTQHGSYSDRDPPRTGPGIRTRNTCHRAKIAIVKPSCCRLGAPRFLGTSSGGGCNYAQSASTNGPWGRSCLVDWLVGGALQGGTLAPRQGSEFSDRNCDRQGGSMDRPTIAPQSPGNHAGTSPAAPARQAPNLNIVLPFSLNNR